MTSIYACFLCYIFGLSSALTPCTYGQWRRLRRVQGARAPTFYKSLSAGGHRG